MGHMTLNELDNTPKSIELQSCSDHRDSEFKNKQVDLVFSNTLFEVITEFTHITSHSSCLLVLLITDAPG